MSEMNESSALRPTFSRRKLWEKRFHTPGLSSKYESLDYEFLENEILKEEEKSAEYSNVVWHRQMNRWIVCCFIGFGTAAIGVLVYCTVEQLTDLKFEWLSSKFESCIGKHCLHMVLLLWVLCNVGCVLLAAVLTVFITGPVAAGSGIPQIKCFLNGVKIPGVLRISALCTKVTGVISGMVAGLAIGKEGPMIHAGACVAGGVSQGRCITCPMDCKVFEYFRSDKEKRDFVSAGTAAGVAAAFNAPIGGVLFAMEEGASYWSQGLTWRTFFTSMCCYTFFNVILSLLYGQSFTLGWSGTANFGEVDNIEYTIWELPFFALVGIIGGLSGALFNSFNARLIVFRKRYISGRLMKLVEALLIAAVTGTIAFVVIFLCNECHPLGTTKVAYPAQLWCPDGHYNEMASLIFRTPESAVKALFHYSQDAFHVSGLLVFLFYYGPLACLTYGIQVPSGLFVPLLLIGATWGRIFGIIMTKIFSNGLYIFPAKYAIIGAGAQLSGSLRMTISLCVILMEAVQNLRIGLPLVIAMFTAKCVGDQFNKGIYDTQIEILEIPILPWEPPTIASTIPATQVMSSPVLVVQTVERVSKVVEMVRRSKSHGFPVVSGLTGQTSVLGHKTFGRLEGFITKEYLITLLHNKVFKQNPSDLPDERLSLEDFRTLYPRYQQTLDLMTFSDKELSSWMDLTPYMDTSPHSVTADASLRKIFNLLRQLGLRYVVTVDKEHQVLGIITRKDIARFKDYKDKKLRRFRVQELFISSRSVLE